jgi:hypothetical protein
VPPTVLQALRRAARATAANLWLAPVGLVVGVVRGLAALPAQLFAVAILQLAASSWGMRIGPLRAPGTSLDGVLVAATSPRFVGIALGLWLAGLLISAVVRVGYLAGALATLGRDLAGAPPARAFAPAFAFGVAGLLPAAGLAFAVELGASAALAGAAVGAAIVARGAPVHPVVGAAVAAAALAGAALASVVAGAVADATLARAAIRGDPPLRALARAAWRVGRRPAAFVAVALAATAAQLVFGGSAEALAAVAAGAGPTHPLVLLGPQLMVAVLGMLVAVLAELWRLAAVAILACHAEPGDDPVSAGDGGPSAGARSSGTAAPAPTA